MIRPSIRRTNIVFLFLLLAFQAFADQRESLPVSVQELIRYEQEHMLTNAGTVSIGNPARYSRHKNEQGIMYRPETGTLFQVESYWVDAEDWHSFQATNMSEYMQQEMMRIKDGKKQVRILVHPESKNFWMPYLKNAELAESYNALASSSSRTLLVWRNGEESRPFFAKLSLDQKIAISRLMRPSEIVRSVGTNEILNLSQKQLPASFKLLPEVWGITPKGADYGGMIIREIPDEIIVGEKKFLPLFSILTSGKNKTPPELLRMIKESGLSTEEFLQKKIIRPFVEQWVTLAVEQGISMDPHTQNILIGVGKDGLPNGEYLHRDFGGFHVDIEYRKQNALPMPESLPHIRSISQDFLQEDIREKFFKSMDLHYRSGTLYSIESKLQEWSKAGLLIPKKWRRGTLDSMLAKELSSVFHEKYGINAKLGKKLLGLNYSILSAQNTFRGKPIPPKPSLQEQCAQLFRVLLQQ